MKHTLAMRLAFVSATAGCPEHDLDSRLEARQATATGALAGYLPYDVYPNAQAANVSKYIAAAKSIAGDDLYAYYARDCLFQSAYSQLDDAADHDGLASATEVFRNLYFVGLSSWTSWAYDTGDGLVIYDTLASAAEAENIILPGLANHEHFDHYDGAWYLQENFSPIVVASQAAWEAMEAMPANANPPPPVRDAKAITITKDGTQITLGNLTTTIYLTPGRTTGTISYILPVTDVQTGENLQAGMYGGSGASRTAWSLGVQVTQLERFAQIAREKGVSALLSNHHSRDSSLYHIEELSHRVCTGPDGIKSGTCNYGHPWVRGGDAYYRWAMMQSLCIRAQAARGGYILSQ